MNRIRFLGSCVLAITFCLSYCTESDACCKRRCYQYIIEPCCPWNGKIITIEQIVGKPVTLELKIVELGTRVELLFKESETESVEDVTSIYNHSGNVTSTQCITPHYLLHPSLPPQRHLDGYSVFVDTCNRGDAYYEIQYKVRNKSTGNTRQETASFRFRVN